ncbi:hypothetical protein CANMA_005385 [Candida margitis]|uniref:uncharacterized protein n=1 Tax=Candida margitis TaxID=1775924 RepID=UPI0022276C82|nr:uncharacterized protein CANMA_005385 [Candida margitis]KAI5950195.1 hypothetical protein CANMA_005385 [Candida margitis]
MTIYSFFIFDRHCNCVYDREYTHSPNPSATTQDKIDGQINKNNDADNSKLLFGILYSLKTIAAKLVLEDSVLNELKQLTIGQYRIHFWESLTRFKFVIITDIQVQSLQQELWQLYSHFFIRYVVENALSPVEFKWKDDDSLQENEIYGKINNGRFIQETDRYLKSLSIF